MGMSPRQLSAYSFRKLAQVLRADRNSRHENDDRNDRTTWNLSEAFLAASIDDITYSPLDNVAFNPETRRYEITFVGVGVGGDQDDDAAGGAGGNVIGGRNVKTIHNKNHVDDAILQAMVMWNLFKLQNGKGREAMLKELSVWDGPQESAALADGAHQRPPNLWKDEIDQLKGKEKSGFRSLSHADSYIRSFCKYYDAPKSPRFHRRSKHTCMMSHLHLFAEQATVQWALSAFDDGDDEGSSPLRHLASDIIRHLYHYNEDDVDDDDIDERLDQLLLRVAEKCKGRSVRTFCQKVDEAIEERGRCLRNRQMEQSQTIGATTTTSTGAAVSAVSPKDQPRRLKKRKARP